MGLSSRKWFYLVGFYILTCLMIVLRGVHMYYGTSRELGNVVAIFQVVGSLVGEIEGYAFTVGKSGFL